MLDVLRNTWALLLGVLLLTLGNGLQGTLLGVRGSLEGFSAGTMSIVMSAFFFGFLFGSRLAPKLIVRVGHVRVFAALGSLISAILVLYAVFPDPILWTLLRIVIGFCFSGVYVVAESWLNEGSSNDNRGKALSVYMIVQMIGVVTAQFIMNFGDPAGYLLFVISSVAVSISFLPILLSVSPAPLFETAAPMSVRKLIQVSPLGTAGCFVLGAVFAGLWGMGAVYGTEAGLTVEEIVIFIAVIYVGGMLCQYPIGWISDRIDRRILIVAAAAICAATSFFGAIVGDVFFILLCISFVLGGIVIPLYSLIIAYTNDFLEPRDMASAAGGLIFIHGLGAIGGPLLVGWMMVVLGPAGFFHYIGGVMTLLVGFAALRMFARPAAESATTASYTPVNPVCSPVAVDMAQEYACEQIGEE